MTEPLAFLRFSWTCVCGLIVLGASPAVLAQNATVTMSSASGSPGSTVSIPVSYTSNGAQVAGLMWTFDYSGTDISNVAVSAGPAATAASKTIQCNSPAAGQYTCIIDGMNADIIADGTVATANFTISSTTTSSTAVQIVNTSAAAADGSAVTLSGTGSAITIATTVITPSGLSCTPASVTAPGGSSTCTVTLSGPAPSGGTVVSLTSSAAGATVSMPNSVTVSAGSTTAQFTVTISGAGGATSVQISATANSTTKTFTVSVTAASISVSVTPSNASVTAGQTQQFTATVSGNSNTSVVWSIAPSVGTISSSGLYTAPSSVTAQQTITVTATSAADNTTTGTATVIVNPASMTAITVDANISTDQGTASTTITTPAFSTVNNNELLLAFISTGGSSTTTTTVTSVSGADLTWSLVQRTNTQGGTSEIWRAFATTPVTGASVTATLSRSITSSMTVMSFTGVDTSGTNGSGAVGAVASGSAASGAPTASLVTTRANSLVIGVGNDSSTATSRTPASGQILVHQYLSSGTGDTYWVQVENNTTPAADTTVTISDTSPTFDRYNLTICEILAAQSSGTSYTVSGTISPSASGPGATVTLSGGGITSTATADTSGNYTLSGIPAGTYTVTPSKSGFTFSPTSQTVTVGTGNVSGVNFTATAVQTTWSVSGTVTPSSAGAGATITLTGSASATATAADASGNFTFSGLANGTYTVTPSKAGYTFSPANQTITINGANIAGLTFTATATTTSGSIAIDATASGDSETAKSTVTTSVFSTQSGNELLLAFVSTDYVSGTNTTVTSISGAALTWQLVIRTNAQSGTSEIWRAFATSPLSNVSVTATLSQSVAASITVMSYTGVDTSGSNGSGAIGATASHSSSSGAPTASLTTTRNNSWVFGVGNDYDNAIARTPASGQNIVHQYLAPVGDTYWVQMQNSPTPLSGTAVAINDTAPTGDRYNLSICEILPAP